MNKQDIDQSETSWLIYSDYLEENNQLALAEQIRFELDYRPSNYPPPYGGSVDSGNYVGDNIFNGVGNYISCYVGGISSGYVGGSTFNGCVGSGHE